MPLKTKELPKKDRKSAPILEPGTYPARLVQVIDLGLQVRTYKGQEKDPEYNIWTTYELLDEFMPDEDGNPDETQPRWVSEDFPLYNLEVDRATSTARYYALDPNEEEDGDWSALLGRPVMVTLVVNESKGKQYNNISSISSMRAKEKEKAPDLVNPSKFFDLSNPDKEIFLSLPKFLQDKIKEGLEFDGSFLEDEKKSSKKKENKKVEEDNDDEEDW